MGKFSGGPKPIFEGRGCLVLSPAVDSILRDADQHYNDQSQDKLRPMVEEGREVLGHYCLLQSFLIVSDEVGDGEDKRHNWIEEQKSQWVDKKFPPNKSEERKSQKRQNIKPISPENCVVSSGIED